MTEVNLKEFNKGPNAELDNKECILSTENDELNIQANDMRVTSQVIIENEYPFAPFIADFVDFR